MSAGASVVAHGVHYGVLAVGLAGLFYLLGPSFATGRQGHRTEHEHRVLALREQMGQSTVARPFVLAHDTSAGRTLLPFVVISSVSAAAVHAAVGPEHFRERTLFGLFFAGTAIAQMVWAVAIVSRPSRALLAAGLAGNLAVVLLWAVTRSYGLPFGLLPRPEAVGAWDVCCVLWELGVAAGCVALLRGGRTGLEAPRWREWSVVARTWAAFSVLVLVSLSVSGAAA